MELLTQLHNARTVKVIDPAHIEAELDLGFGVKIVRRLRLEGLDSSVIPPHLKDRAQHAMVVLIGGKKLVVRLNPDTMDNTILSRVYLDERIYGAPEGLESVNGSDKLLEVSGFVRWLAARNFDLGEVFYVLNGRRK